MPSSPPYGSKNVHFKEKDDGLESVRIFRRTGKPVSVSKPTSDTETETEPELSAYPFPHINNFGSSGSSLTEIANCSTVPAPSPSPYTNMYLESITLPPAQTPILHGTVLVLCLKNTWVCGSLSMTGPPCQRSWWCTLALSPH
jgi:hypothetical protein